jgi:hypothetical protein
VQEGKENYSKLILFSPFSCPECDRRFNSQMLLEYHKEDFGHWSDDDFVVYADAAAAFEVTAGLTDNMLKKREKRVT